MLQVPRESSSGYDSIPEELNTKLTQQLDQYIDGDNDSLNDDNDNISDDDSQNDDDLQGTLYNFLS